MLLLFIHKYLREAYPDYGGALFIQVFPSAVRTRRHVANSSFRPGLSQEDMMEKHSGQREDK